MRAGDYVELPGGKTGKVEWMSAFSVGVRLDSDPLKVLVVLKDQVRVAPKQGAMELGPLPEPAVSKGAIVFLKAATVSITGDDLNESMYIGSYQKATVLDVLANGSWIVVELDNGPVVTLPVSAALARKTVEL